MPRKKTELDTKSIFTVFTEIGIIYQLSRARFERHMPDKLTLPHFNVLNHLVRLGDGKSPLNLAEAFQVPKNTMTHTLAGLEELGLIDAQPNPRDGRGKLIYLTKAGKRFREQAINSLAPDMAVLAQHFDFARLNEVLPILQELREVMDRNRDI